MTTAIIDYGSGNLRSASKAFERMAAEVNGGDILVTSDPDAVSRADRIVLPGVGAFLDCRDGLMAVDGMFEAVRERVAAGTPFLGICVGMQLMARIGREYEDTRGLGWIDGEVIRIAPADPSLKVPHMGWNDLVIDQAHPIFEGISTGAHAYFVHSYHFGVANPTERLAHVEYAGDVTAVVGRDTMLGMQFHPEKSAQTGLRLIANFLNWRP